MENVIQCPTKIKTTAEINQYLQCYNLEQLNFLLELLKSFSTDQLSKGDLMHLVLNEDQKNKCDSALPCEYVENIRELLPTFESNFYCFDYSNNRTFGEMLNLAETLVFKMSDNLNVK